MANPAATLRLKTTSTLPCAARHRPRSPAAEEAEESCLDLASVVTPAPITRTRHPYSPNHQCELSIVATECVQPINPPAKMINVCCPVLFKCVCTCVCATARGESVCGRARACVRACVRVCVKTGWDTDRIADIDRERQIDGHQYRREASGRLDLDAASLRDSYRDVQDDMFRCQPALPRKRPAPGKSSR